MQKPEIEKKIFLHLTKVDFSTLDEMKKLFQCTTEDLMNVVKNNIKTDLDPLGFILVDTNNIPHRYSIEPTNYDTIHVQINTYLKGINGVLTLFYRNLSVQSNLFKNNSDTSINSK